MSDSKKGKVGIFHTINRNKLREAIGLTLDVLYDLDPESVTGWFETKEIMKDEELVKSLCEVRENGSRSKPYKQFIEESEK